MSEENRIFTLFMTMGGTGNHMTMDLLAPLDLDQVDSNLIYFWCTYVVARQTPDVPSVSKFFKGMTAKESLAGFYRKFTGDDSGDLLDFDRATAAFGHFLDSRPGTRKYTIHIHSMMHAYLGPSHTWTPEQVSQSRECLERALEALGWEVRHAALLRHPLDVLLSNLERFGRDTPEPELLRQVLEFHQLVENYRVRLGERLVIVTYEQMCAGDLVAVRRLLDHLGLAEVSLSDLRLDFLHGGEVRKYLGYPLARARDLAEQTRPALSVGGYPLPDESAFAFLTARWRKALAKLAAEIRMFNMVFSGDFTPKAAMFRHHRSFLGAVYWQLNLLIPRRRHHYETLYRTQYDRPMPTPRLERLVRRLLGLPIQS